MAHVSIRELFVILILTLIRFGIPIAFAIWIIIAIKRIIDGIKRLGSRLDVIEKYLMDKEAGKG